jgi:hypothetical protein
MEDEIAGALIDQIQRPRFAIENADGVIEYFPEALFVRHGSR